MEIKHTFEILAKDIQDIEKLVRNIQNSPKPEIIDFDLALTKLRNVYEVLIMIREDHLSQVDRVTGTVEKSVDTPAPPAAKPAFDTFEIEEPIGTSDYNEDTVAEAPEAGVGKKTLERETVIGEKEIAESNRIKVEEELQKKVTDAQADLTRARQVKPKKDAEILADKFNLESSLNENLGSKRAGDVTSRLASQPIDSISRNIGINDRFFIIKELFKGDSEGFNNIIRNLDQSNNFNEAFRVIEDRFPDTIDHDGVQILVNLARRRFISSGNV